MPPNDGARRCVDAGMSLVQTARQRAEELARELVSASEVERIRAQEFVEDLARRSRQTSEAFVTEVRAEVRQQLDELGIATFDDLARRVAEVIGDLPGTVRSAARSGARKASSTFPAPSSRVASPAKKAPAKKAPAKKAPAKKAAH